MSAGAECPHTASVLVRLNCGAGGIQYRRYCAKCWRDLLGAIPHEAARKEEIRTGVVIPLADIEQLRAARDCYFARTNL